MLAVMSNGINKSYKRLSLSKVFIGGVFVSIGLNLVSCNSVTLPSCSSSEIVSLANKTLNNSFIGMIFSEGNKNPLALESPTEDHVDYLNERRICKGVVNTIFGGSQLLFYSISWHNRSTGEIWLEFIDKK